MANIPIKWGKVGTDGKAEVNGADNTTFSSSSPAFKVNGDEEITGDSSVGGGQSITGNSSVGGNHSVTGDETVGGDLTVTGDGSIGGNLIVDEANTTNKVGINVASPSEALDVDGNAKVSGSIFAGDDISATDDITAGGDLSASGNASVTGTITSNYKSGSWVTSLTKSAFNVPDASNSYGGWICGPTKDGRIAISTYQADNNNLYFGYGERGRTTNSFAKKMTWTGTNGFLTIDGSFITNFSGTGSYNEGIRINKSSNNWSTLHMGGTGETGSGAGQWGIFVNHTSYPRRLMIGHGSSSTNTYFSARSDSQTSPDLVCGNTTIYGTGSNGGLNSMLVGDDCYLGDCNVGGHLGLKAAASDSCGIKCYNNGGTLRGGVTFNNGTVDIYYNGTQHRLGCNQLYSGSLAPTGQCSWSNYANYNSYIVVASLEGGNATTITIVPRNTFTSSRQASSSYIIADDAYWCVCYMWYSGTTGYLYMEAGRSDCRIKYVFGLN